MDVILDDYKNKIRNIIRQLHGEVFIFDCDWKTDIWYVYSVIGFNDMGDDIYECYLRCHQLFIPEDKTELKLKLKITYNEDKSYFEVIK
jgi:hypothetical protein